MNLWFALISTVGVLAIVGGAYWYVTSLQHKVQQLSTENETLTNSNKTLDESLKDIQKQQSIIVKVDAIGEAQRKRNRETLDNQKQQISDKVNRGQDKPVGPLLKEFLNDE